MAYIKCRWYEPAYQSEDRGIIPAVWLEEHGGHQIVRWPPWSQYQQPYEMAQLPKADWKIVLLIEILSNAGTESDCDILIEYTSKDEERQPRQKRRKITDFMTTEEYGGCVKSGNSTGFPPSPFGKPISVTSDLQVLMEQADLPVDLNGASDTDQSKEPKPSTSPVCASDNAGSIDCARTKQGFNNKDAETAIADWLRQAGNSYMKANKT